MQRVPEVVETEAEPLFVREGDADLGPAFWGLALITLHLMV